MRERRRVATICSFALAAVSLQAPLALVACDGDGDRTDVILVVVDTLRADHLGAYGYPRPTSPRLDLFARDATVFEDVISPAPWTLPAVASILTSTYPSVHGLRSHTGSDAFTSMRSNLTTLAERFAVAGYRTVAVGTNPWINTAEHGLQRGFQEYLVPKRIRAGQVNAIAREVLADDDPRPVFLYLHYMDVHGPYTARYDTSIPDLGPVDPRYVRRLRQAERDALPGYLVLKEVADLDGYLDAYDRGIRRWDRSFGALVDWLAASGRLESSIVSVTSDHGEEFLEHGGWNHGLTVYDEQIRVPWILRVPGAPGRRLTGLVSLIDVGPTLLNLAGVAVPDSMMGVDALAATAPDSDRAVLSESHIEEGAGQRPDGRSTVAMVRGKTKWVVGAGRTLCFDLARDPAETRRADCDAEGFAELRDRMQSLAERAAALGQTTRFEPAPERKAQLRELGYTE